MKCILPISLVCLCMLGCEQRTSPKKKTGVGTRIAAVKPATKKGAVNDPSGFCEKTYPNQGSQTRAFEWPALRPLPGQKAAQPPQLDGRWTWLNLWATWCEPCLDEMDLLGRWTKSLAADGPGMALHLLTIDAESAAEALSAQIKVGLPGPTTWIRDEHAFPPFLKHLGLDPAAAIPIHALVDPAGQLRCVRVGAISALDFAAVKSIIRGG